MNNGGGVNIPLYTYAYALQLISPAFDLDFNFFSHSTTSTITYNSHLLGLMNNE